MELVVLIGERRTLPSMRVGPRFTTAQLTTLLGKYQYFKVKNASITTVDR